MLDETPQAQRNWRLAVACAITLMFLHIMWACGYGARFGVYGFAQAADVTEIKSKLDAAAYAQADVQVKLLKKSIVDMQIQRCEASSKKYFTERLNELKDEYLILAKERFDMPTCEELR